MGGKSATARERVTDHFARGQFMELTEQQKLEGRSFETFTNGVRVGTTAYTVANAGTTVKADYEVEILEPEPVLNLHWKVTSRYREVLAADTALTLSAFGAAANSARAKSAALQADIGKGAIREAPLAVVDPGTLVERWPSASRAALVRGHRRADGTGERRASSSRRSRWRDERHRLPVPAVVATRAVGRAPRGERRRSSAGAREGHDRRRRRRRRGPGRRTSTQLHGPGDVIGLDPTVIVRTIPRPGSTNVEPNYLAAVDFDQPELPWLFTPAGVPALGPPAAVARARRRARPPRRLRHRSERAPSCRS